MAAAMIKKRLKAAQEAIGAKEFDKARNEAQKALEFDASNYRANVYLGIALMNLGEHAQSEQAYRSAISSDEKHPLAWQGLSKLYEKLEDWPEHLKTQYQLAELHAKSNDATKCAEAVQSIVQRHRSGGSTPEQLAQALSLYLPDSPFYPILFTLPPPDLTNPTSTTTFEAQSAIQNSLPIIEELVDIYEKAERGVAEEEIKRRRQRLNGPSLDQTLRDVALERISNSKLPALYNEIINHPQTTDDLRRNTESKLLEMTQQHLFSIPADDKHRKEKARVAAALDELIGGIVLLKIPNQLAWTLTTEGKDAEHIEDYDFQVLQQYSELFPKSPLSQMIGAYFAYMDIHPDEDEEEEGRPNVLVEDPEVCVDVMMEAFSSLSDSILAHRLIAHLYEQGADYENAIKVAESGLELVSRAERDWGRPSNGRVDSFTLPACVRKALNITLATSLVHHFPPKHHLRALKIVDELLRGDPDNIPSLMAKGFILYYAKKWSQASEVFGKVAALDHDGLLEVLRAKEEHAWCEAMCGNLVAAADELRVVIETSDELEGHEEDKARAWWRLGRCYWEMGEDHREEAYKYFVTSLKRSSTFAPAFTSLGIYYAEFLSPPDPNRASKCFEKAFVLDPREGDAARRLAEGFAEEGDWDLVNVVAQRAIEGEGGAEDGPEVKASRRYRPINAWAWKAVGAVELTRRNYASAIEPLQIALRTDVDDYMSWLRLGEAYNKAGRYAAALKALEHARELDPNDWVASYFLGDVQRQMGVYEEAIKAFESILDVRPQELGVLDTLGQTYLDLGRLELSTGFSARAEGSFVSAIRVTLELVDASPGFRRVAWKTMADALFHLSSFSILTDEEMVLEVVSSVAPLVTDHPGQGLTALVPCPLVSDENTSTPVFALQVALASYDYRLSLGTLNDTVKGTAHYDLGIALSTFARRTLDSAKRERAQDEAITQFKNAIRAVPSNDSFWIALGNATFATQPSLCQHSFVRALEIDSKNAATWTTLGMFYLQHDDAVLAMEAFDKAQTLDPDYALAWVGQALVASSGGHDRDASTLFEHATSLTATVPEADLEFATRVFRKVNESSTKSRAASSEALLPAFFVLDRYCKQRPQDAAALHLFGLVCERVGHVELGVEMIARAIAVLEAAYEETEDPVIERQFTIAHTNAARLRLATGDFDGALESYGVATSLMPEGEAANEESDSDTHALLAQCQFGSGLAHFKLGRLPEALAQFEAAMATAANHATIRGHVVVLLAQTLWAIGTDEAKESAKSQLLQSIEYDPENLMAVNTLAGMGILTQDDGLVDAALSELLSLPLDQRHERDPEREVTYLLVQHHLGQSEVGKAMSVAQKAVFTEPARSDARQELASLALRTGDRTAALAVLGGATSARADFAHLRASLALYTVVLCLEVSGGDEQQASEALRLAQKGVMLSPWDLRAWETLAYVRSHCAE
ncbi:TPR-like protein [Epithele typhae]|uniref:TPR-like protein n=1 Tax=Epithele typhae TaxID=378194 RepID=UPI00200849D8|nr:TPR-like protein [Epithele typhae]KAH9940522.1 TPR-like protein [Epithele typhae]